MANFLTFGKTGKMASAGSPGCDILAFFSLPVFSLVPSLSSGEKALQCVLSDSKQWSWHAWGLGSLVLLVLHCKDFCFVRGQLCFPTSGLWWDTRNWQESRPNWKQEKQAGLCRLWAAALHEISQGVLCSISRIPNGLALEKANLQN